MTSLARELEAAIHAARQAGEHLKRDQRKPTGPRGHGDKADADLEAERMIHAILSEAFPDYGYIGEEDPKLNAPARDPKHSIWLIDPNDGTRAYLRGWRGNSVSIGLLQDGQPVLGVVLAPCAPDDAGDLFVWAEGMPAIERNGVAQPTLDDAPLGERDVLLLSQAADRRPKVHAELSQPARYQPMPSIAYRLALAACGDYAAAVSLHGPDNYDVGAGHALLRGAGGVLLNEFGEEWTYARSGSLNVHGLSFGGRRGVSAMLGQRDWMPARRSPQIEYGEFDPRNLRPGLFVEDTTLLDRARGCLIGLLCGDALGACAEGLSAGEIAERWPDGLREMHACESPPMLRGQISDDGELALALARSIARCEGYAPAHAIRAYAHWFRSNPAIIGETTRTALEAAHLALGSRDSSWPDGVAHARPIVLETVHGAANRESLSNGFLIRVAPLGLLAVHASMDDLMRWCEADAKLTHPHPIQAQAGFALAAGIALSLREPDMTAADLHARVQDACASRECDARVIAALKAATQGAPEPKRDGSEDNALTALHMAWALVLACDSASEAIIQAAALGGDTDTNAAITGALCGAHFGLRSIDREWVSAVITARPINGRSEVGSPRPMSCWAVDAMHLPELLLEASRSLADGA